MARGPMIAVLDANVLYPATLRSFLLYLSAMGVFHARWSGRIHEEWMRAVRVNHPEIPEWKLERTRALMDAHAEQCVVEGYESKMELVELPDVDDRHVVAAAIAAGAGVIVTANVRDFPAEAVGQFGIEALTADAFVMRLVEWDAGGVCEGFRRHREGLRNPPRSAEDVLGSLRRCGLERTVEALGDLRGQL